MAGNNQGRLRAPARLQPAQGVSSTFVQTNEGSRGKQIAEALQGFNQSIGRMQDVYMQEKREKQQKIDAIEAAKTQERLVNATEQMKVYLQDPENSRQSPEDFFGNDNVQSIISQTTEGLSEDAAALLAVRLNERFSSMHSLQNQAVQRADTKDGAGKFARYTIQDRIDQYQSVGMEDGEISKEMAPVFAAVERSLREEFGLSNNETMEVLKSVQHGRGLDQKDAYLGEWILGQQWGGNGYKEDITNLVYNARNGRKQELREQGESMFLPFREKALYGQLTPKDMEDMQGLVEKGYVSSAEVATLQVQNKREADEAVIKAADAQARSDAFSSALDGYSTNGYFTSVNYTLADGTVKTITTKQLEDRMVADVMKKFDGNLPAQVAWFVQNPTLKNPHWEQRGKLFSKQLAGAHLPEAKETLDLFDAIYSANPKVLTDHLSAEDSAVYLDYRMLTQVVGQDKAAGMLVNSFGQERPEVSNIDASEFADSFLSNVEGFSSNANDRYVRDYAYSLWKRVGNKVHMSSDEFMDHLETQFEESTVEVNGGLVYTLGMDLKAVGGKQGLATAAPKFIEELSKQHPYFSAYTPEQMTLAINPARPNTFVVVTNGMPQAAIAFSLEEIRDASVRNKLAVANGNLEREEIIKTTVPKDEFDDEVDAYLNNRGYN